MPFPSRRHLGRTLPALVLAALVLALVARPGAPAASAHASVAVQAASPAGGPDAHRPNIIMVMADDMRTDDLRYMPNVRKLIGGRGLTFRNSFSPYPLCCPARASFLTGRYAHNHHVFSHEAPWGFKSFDDHATIAGTLQKAGYRTGFVGKYLNGYGAQPSLVTGKPSFHYVPAGWTDWYGAVERPVNSPYKAGGTYNYWHTIFNINGVTDDTHAGQYQTNVLGGFSRKLVRKYAGGSKPFFLYLSFVAPHFGGREKGDPLPVTRSNGMTFKFETPGRPLWVRGKFNAQITRAPGMPLDGGPSERDMSDKPPAMRKLPEMNAVERRRLTQVARQRAEAEFVLDKQVAALVKQLRDSGELSDTVLMFTSDNGYFMGEHRQRTGKIKPHEPSLRVPFLVAGPGVPQGERFDPITTEDITATIADLAGATPYLPYPPDGSSRVPTIRQGDQGWSTPVVTEGLIGNDGTRTSAEIARGFTDARNVIGVRTGRWKLERYAGGAEELYDLDNDPNELHSVAGNPKYATVQAELTDLWWQLKDCVGTDCRPTLPPDFLLGPDAERRGTNLQSRGVKARYGYWR
ncbi:MAG: sulfatase family protein [Nocardioides sp.]